MGNFALGDVHRDAGHVPRTVHGIDHAADGAHPALAARGMVIYPGKVSRADCFRIGTIGRIFPEQVLALVSEIEAVLAQMGVTMPRPE